MSHVHPCLLFTVAVAVVVWVVPRVSRSQRGQWDGNGGGGAEEEEGG